MACVCLAGVRPRSPCREWPVSIGASFSLANTKWGWSQDKTTHENCWASRRGALADVETDHDANKMKKQWNRMGEGGQPGWNTMVSQHSVPRPLQLCRCTGHAWGRRRHRHRVGSHEDPSCHLDAAPPLLRLEVLSVGAVGAGWAAAGWGPPAPEAAGEAAAGALTRLPAPAPAPPAAGPAAPATAGAATAAAAAVMRVLPETVCQPARAAPRLLLPGERETRECLVAEPNLGAPRATPAVASAAGPVAASAIAGTTRRDPQTPSLGSRR